MKLLLPGFSAGALSPAIEGRADIEAIKQGCRRAENVIPQRLGGLWQRPGFMFRSLAGQQEQPVILRPFVAGTDQGYRLEFGDGYLRIWNFNSVVPTRADNVGKPGCISAAGTPLVLATPYGQNDLRAIQLAQANDVMWLVHPLHPPQRLVRYQFDGFYFEPMSFSFPPLRDENVEEVTISASGTTGSITLTATGDVFEAGNVGGYFGISHTRPLPVAEISLSAGSSIAVSDLILTGLPVAGETVLIGTGSNLRTYTWDSAGPYGVAIDTTGGTTAEKIDKSLDNLADAINGRTNANPGTVAHPSVTAENLGDFSASIAAAGTLAFTDNNLTAGTPDKFLINGQAYYFSNDVTTGAAYGVKRGATLEDSILNAIAAINLSGAAGVNYTAGTAANPDVTADAAPTGNTLRVVAQAAGAAGNAITTTVQDTSRMSWGSPTLTGGADASTNKLRASARIAGVSGNSIAVAETMTAGEWQPAGFLAGGADTVAPDPIPTIRVNGQWEVATLGRWSGTLTLQQQRSTGEWETVRAWSSQNDFNVQATGETDGERVMRLIYTGSGIADDQAPARATLTAVDPQVNGLVLITGVSSPTVATGTVIRELWSTEATYLWAEGAWNERRGYPSAVTIHQQRLVFGHDIRVTGSQTGGFDNFERTTLADAAYFYDLAAQQVTPIVGLQSQKGLIILTSSEEWLMDGGQPGAVITPQTVRTERQSSYGAASLQSELIHSSVVYVQQGSEILNEYVFDFGQDGYEAVNLTELVDHFGGERIIQIAWAPMPHSLIWAVTEQGSLLSCAYRRAQKQIAWTKHTTPNGVFESVCCVSTGGVTDVWVSVCRTTPQFPLGVRTLESFQLDYWDNLKNETPSNLSVLDGAVAGISPGGQTSVSGLSHLEGMTVAILAEGAVHPPQVVTGGSITFRTDYGRNGSVTSWVIGLAPLAVIQPFFLEVSLRDGSSQGRHWKVAKLNPRLYQTGAAMYTNGEETDPLFDVFLRRPPMPMGQPVPLFTGLMKLDLGGGYTQETIFRFENQSPLPMNLLNVGIEGDVVG